MHAEHHVPLDFKIYEFNLEHANTIKPEFTLFAEMKKHFKMKSLSPSSFSQLSESFNIDEKAAIKYTKFFWKNGPDGDISACD
jgi:hypothetical protein